MLAATAMTAVRETLKPGERVRVLVVDDSVVVRRLISRMVEDEPSMELAGTARDGLDALAKIPLLRPHVVTLDVEMPELDGIATLRRIVELRLDVRVIMLSSLTAKGSQTTVDALMLGASDYVTKPQGDASGNAFESLAVELVHKIKQLFAVETGEAIGAGSTAFAPPARDLRDRRLHRRSLGTYRGLARRPQGLQSAHRHHAAHASALHPHPRGAVDQDLPDSRD